MFTGIVEEIGTIQAINQVSDEAIQLKISAEVILEDIHLGDSISVNGVCLTVTEFSNGTFQTEIMPETARATSLNKLTVSSQVNLERSVAANGRFGGHFVTGHVDAIGKIIRRETVENAIYYDIAIPTNYMKYFILKGSVAIDGVSLTVFDFGDNWITISLIPHTVLHSILGKKGVGDIVNVECDMLAKQVERQLQIK